MEKVIIYCKIVDSTKDTEGNGALLFTKDKPETLDLSVKMLKEWKGRDVQIIIMPLIRNIRGEIV